MTFTDVVETLVVAANLGVFLLIVLMVNERLRAGYSRIERQVQDIVLRRSAAEADRDQLSSSMDEHRQTIATIEGNIRSAQEELASLEKRHAEIDLPVHYSATPLEEVDFRFPGWRLVAINPYLGQRALQLTETAYQWNEGRHYDIPAPTHATARAILEKLLPPGDGFTVRLVTDEKSVA